MGLIGFGDVLYDVSIQRILPVVEYARGCSISVVDDELKEEARRVKIER